MALLTLVGALLFAEVLTQERACLPPSAPCRCCRAGLPQATMISTRSNEPRSTTVGHDAAAAG